MTTHEARIGKKDFPTLESFKEFVEGYPLGDEFRDYIDALDEARFPAFRKRFVTAYNDIVKAYNSLPIYQMYWDMMFPKVK